MDTLVPDGSVNEMIVASNSEGEGRYSEDSIAAAKQSGRASHRHKNTRSNRGQKSVSQNTAGLKKRAAARDERMTAAAVRKTDDHSEKNSESQERGKKKKQEKEKTAVSGNSASSPKANAERKKGSKKEADVAPSGEIDANQAIKQNDTAAQIAAEKITEKEIEASVGKDAAQEAAGQPTAPETPGDHETAADNLLERETSNSTVKEIGNQDGDGKGGEEEYPAHLAEAKQGDQKAEIESEEDRDKQRRLGYAVQQTVKHVLAAKFADQIYGEWESQAGALKEEYSTFDLARECRENPRFLSLLKAGVPLKQAYEVTNLTQIKANIEAQSAQQAIAYMMERIRTVGLRPSENGVHSPNAMTLGSNIASLSRGEREEIARRARKGEKVTL